MRRNAFWAVCVVALMAAGCGKRTEAEHQLLMWGEALNRHLATDMDGGYAYPYKLVDVDPMLRPAFSFADPWGTPLHYRRVNDSVYDLVSAGANRRLGDDDDVILNNAVFKKPATFYPERPAKGLVAQDPNDRPTHGGRSGGLFGD